MAENTRFPSRIAHIRPGEAVSAGVSGRAARSLEERTNYLREAISAIEDGRLLVYKDQLIDPELLIGQPTFWNAETQRYEAAFAAVENDTTTGTLTIAPSADCVGMLLRKHAGAQTGDIALVGVAAFESLADVIDGEAVPGRYYLSAVEPGKLVKQRPAVTVAVCLVMGPTNACDENQWVFIMPDVKDFLEDHIHYQERLTALPAGEHTPPTPGDAHTIENGDADLPGWLPADHAVFNDNAPTGAKFGYNLSAHPSLSRNWPPVPITNAVLEYSKPAAADDTNVWDQSLVRVPGDFVVFDRYGIWWMTDCYDQVPWPTATDTALGSESISSESSSSMSSAAALCPAAPPMYLILSYVKMTFATDKTTVTSLQPATGSPIVYENCDGEAASTGDLFSRLALELLVTDESYGGQVLKEILSGELTFGRGWVTEGLIPLTDRLIVTSSHQRALNPAAAVSVSNPAVHQGIIQLDLNLDPIDRELSPTIVQLGDALERSYLNKTYIGFPEGRDSAIRLQVQVPPDGLPDSPMMKLRMVIFGRVTDTLPELTATYTVLPRPAPGVGEPLSTIENALTFDTEIAVVADEAHEFESDEFAIAAGDTVYVTISRDDADAYSGEVGILRRGLVIVAGA